MVARESNPDGIARRPSHAGRHVLITGAARGIGRSIALAFAARGAALGLIDLDAGDLDQLRDKIRSDGGMAESMPLDIVDYAALVAAVDIAVDRMGRPFDTIINNAGISPKHDGHAHKIWEMEPDEWRQVIDVNLTGTFNTIRALSPVMKAAGKGWIVNTSSVAGKTYSPIVGAHYAATKSAIIGLTKHLAAELGPFGIRVNALAPGRIATPMVAGVAPEINAEQVALTPLGRLGDPDEVADAALWLTSPEASFVTGQTVDVAGGLYMT